MHKFVKFLVARFPAILSGSIPVHLEALSLLLLSSP